MEEFEKELTNLINCYSLENGSDTPDFILAKYLVGCLQAFNHSAKDQATQAHADIMEEVFSIACARRTAWYAQ